MSNRNRFSISVLISAAVVSLAVIEPTARAVDVSFDQIDWGDGSAGFIDQNSQWGQANIGFSSADVGLLTPDGSGGYFGWVNVVTSVSGGSNNNWAVENMPVTFNSLGDLDSHLSLAVNFDLGQTDGTDISSLNYSLTISGTPLASQPGGPLTSAAVASDTVVEGTEANSSSEGGLGFLRAAQDFIGVVVNVVTNISLSSGQISGGQTNIARINEDDNGCAPAAAARSIKYLGSMYPSLNITQTAQQVYGALVTSMNTSIGTNGNGTLPANFVAGKNQYFTTNNLAIGPTAVTNSFGAAMLALRNTNDVEMGLFWGYTDAARTNSLGGHCTFVAGVTEIRLTNSVIGYIVTCIDDPIQGDNIASNTAYNLVFDASGNLLNQGVGAQLNSLRIETVVPEPSTLGLAAFGMAVLMFVRRRRRH